MKLVDNPKLNVYNDEVTERIMFIKLALEARLDLRLTNIDAIYGHVNSKFPRDIDFISKNDGISKEEIDWVNQTVSETLKYSFIFKEIPNIRDLCNEFMETSFSHRGDVVEKFENKISTLKNEFREARVQDSKDTLFSLQGEIFENQITDTYNAVRSQSRRLITGMVGFNILTGGLENGRVYMLIGSSGVGKSITLLNLIYQMKKYNTGYKTKDPTKVPCICLLTMENTMTETITRLFDLINDTRVPMAKQTDLNEVFRILRETGGLTVSGDSPIDIVIKYKPNHSVNTDYLYDLYDELSDNGWEMICLVQDHVKRIRSIESETEFRIELGNIVNEFKNFAAEKDIPVLTDSHINRQGTHTIDSGAVRGVADVTRRIGKSDIGESMMMIENLDMGIVINKEWDEKHNTYMVFSSIKMRDAGSENYIIHPFVDGSTIKLVEDINFPNPVFKTSLRDLGDIYGQHRQNLPSNVANTTYNSIETIGGYDREENYFDRSPEDDRFTKQDIGNVDISNDIEQLNKTSALKATVEEDEEDMWSRALRTGMKCPFILSTANPEQDKKILKGMDQILKQVGAQ